MKKLKITPILLFTLLSIALYAQNVLLEQWTPFTLLFIVGFVTIILFFLIIDRLIVRNTSLKKVWVIETMFVVFITILFFKEHEFKTCLEQISPTFSFVFGLSILIVLLLLSYMKKKYIVLGFNILLLLCSIASLIFCILLLFIKAYRSIWLGIVFIVPIINILLSILLIYRDLIKEIED